jgi:oxidoreductase
MAAAAAAGGEEAKGAAVAAMRALVLGATGETGRCLIKQLAASPRCERVTAVVRRALKDEEVAARWRLSDAEKAKVRQAVVDYEKLDEFREVFQDQTDVFCCLGTT